MHNSVTRMHVCRAAVLSACRSVRNYMIHETCIVLNTSTEINHITCIWMGTHTHGIMAKVMIDMAHTTNGNLEEDRNFFA